MEALHGYPIDGVVLTIGYGKTMPVCPMTVATTLASCCQANHLVMSGVAPRSTTNSK
jgi:GH24 family phage-related lysozyme (muramidase)